MSTTSRAAPQTREPAARPVSQPHDRGEREADRAAEVVAHGGSVAGWSFTSVPASAPQLVQRQEAAKGKSEDEKYKEAAKKAGEAALQTEAGKKLKAQVLADPVVKTVTSPYVLVPAIAGGVAGLAATGKELPVQPPEIPLDRITPGLSAKVTYEGPVNAPTFVGLTITYKEQGPKSRKSSDKDKIAADIARLRAQQQMFKPASQKAAEKQAEDEAVQAWIRSGAGLTIPLTPGAGQKSDVPRKEEEQAPVQPAPESAGATMPSHANVEGALGTPGRPLDAPTRRSMEARFGYDFSRVRIHDDARAAATATSIDAAAFTVGDDIVFGGGRYDTSGPAGRRLLAHELAHVAQQPRRPAEAAHRSPGATARELERDDEDAAGDPTGEVRVVRQGQGSGSRIAAGLARRLGDHFGRDVDDVRIHTDQFAARTAARLRANAFTVERDVFFAPGMYAPEQPEGMLRLAHEVAHSLQQSGTTSADMVGEARLDDEADEAAIHGSSSPLSSVGPAVLREPTYPRRTTRSRMLREAVGILLTTRDRDALDATTRLWSRVQSNFAGSITTGTIARRIWTHIFLRHFTEPETPPGVESAHPRYFYSHTYGWVDAQHFFGFVDFAEQQLAAHPGDREAAFRAATEQGIGIEADQQRIRDYVILGAPPATGPARLMQVRPPNTPLFRSPQMVAGAAANSAATMYASLALRGTQRELFALLNEEQRQKFFLDSAKSAWSYEDIVSNQLGTRFFFQHGTRINGLSPSARESAFVTALSSFFSGIDVEDDQARLDSLARSLPQKERYLRPTTTEERDRQRHPELFVAPAP